MNIKVGVLAVATAALLSAPVQADWDPADGWKWYQEPDLAPLSGIDIAVGQIQGVQRIVADDFQCGLTGPITDIHLWMSYVNDAPIVPPPLLTFRLSIWSDIPAGPQTFSRPGSILWSIVMPPTAAVPVAQVGNPSNPLEYWWDPLYSGTFPSGMDSQVWQFNFDPITDPFIQRAGTIYWLSVEALGDPSGIADDHIGWKTSTMHWNDDAVYRDATGGWAELVYPPGHPKFNPNDPVSIDMAFVITTPEPATYGLIAGLGLIGFAALRRRGS